MGACASCFAAKDEIEGGKEREESIEASSSFVEEGKEGSVVATVEVLPVGVAASSGRSIDAESKQEPESEGSEASSIVEIEGDIEERTEDPVDASTVEAEVSVPEDTDILKEEEEKAPIVSEILDQGEVLVEEGVTLNDVGIKYGLNVFVNDQASTQSVLILGVLLTSIAGLVSFLKASSLEALCMLSMPAFALVLMFRDHGANPTLPMSSHDPESTSFVNHGCVVEPDNDRQVESMDAVSSSTSPHVVEEQETYRMKKVRAQPSKYLQGPGHEQIVHYERRLAKKVVNHMKREKEFCRNLYFSLDTKNPQVGSLSYRQVRLFFHSLQLNLQPPEVATLVSCVRKQRQGRHRDDLTLKELVMSLKACYSSSADS